MNIFILDRNPQLAAQFHCDIHVNKMILESCQMLSTCHWFYLTDLCEDPIIDLEAFPRHPCNRWVRTNAAHYRWLYSLLQSLLCEYTKRYGRTHSKQPLFEKLAEVPPIPNDSGEVRAFVLAMPRKYRDLEDPVGSYRRYYCEDKLFARWNRLGNVPPWVTGPLQLQLGA